MATPIIPTTIVNRNRNTPATLERVSNHNTIFARSAMRDVLRHAIISEVLPIALDYIKNYYGITTQVVNRHTAQFDIYCGRGTQWGNPFIIGIHGDRYQVIDKFKEWVLTSEDESAEYIRNNAKILRGKRLGCSCSPKLCHVHIIMLIAEGLL